MATLGRVPRVGDRIVLPQNAVTSFQEELESGAEGHWLARVTVMDERRVDRTILSPITPEQAEQAKQAQESRQTSNGGAR